ncbi:MAG: hypothetical protein LBI10_00635 [Deltaproteobacteria bacterium]|nr:hypothetical protein [Deltaproteobacteria bacterium]
MTFCLQSRANLSGLKKSVFPRFSLPDLGQDFSRELTMTALVSPKSEPVVGAEIDAYCSKCKLPTNHRIVAIDGGKIKKVICLTCQGQHAFRLNAPKPRTRKSNDPEVAVGAAPAEPKPPKAPRAPRQPKDPKAAVKKNLIIDQDTTNRAWRDLKESVASGRLVPYDMSGSYAVGQAIDHHTFGVGFVTKVILPNKIEVLFESEQKTLIMLVRKA